MAGAPLLPAHRLPLNATDPEYEVALVGARGKQDAVAGQGVDAGHPDQPVRFGRLAGRGG
jgi:hypothetical protein